MEAPTAGARDSGRPIDPRILKAAAQVFVDKGYRGTSMRDLAQAVGVLRGSLYHHIDSKEHLFYAVITGPVRQIVSDAERILDAPDPVPRRLEAFIVAHVSALHRYYPELFVFLQERFPVERTTPGGEEIAQLTRRYEQLVVDLVAEGVRDGSLQPHLDPRLSARALLGMCNWLHTWYRPGRESPGRVASTLCSVVLGGMVKPAATQHDGAPPDGAR